MESSSPRVLLDLREAGETCSKHRVVLLMRINKIRALHGYRSRSYSAEKPAVMSPDFVRRIFDVIRPNKASVGSGRIDPDQAATRRDGSSAAMRTFAGIGLGREAAPDETTVCKFRHLLKRHRLGKQLLAIVNEHLKRSGVKISNGTIVDAKIISAPSLTKNRDG